MLLKPYIPKVNVNSLPSESLNSRKDAHYEYNESMEFLESEGRLLMLTILWHERNLKAEKRIHDIHNVFSCVNTWPVCQCNFAKYIRGIDMNLSIKRIDYLREIL